MVLAALKQSVGRYIGRKLKLASTSHVLAVKGDFLEHVLPPSIIDKHGVALVSKSFILLGIVYSHHSCDILHIV